MAVIDRDRDRYMYIGREANRLHNWMSEKIGRK